MNRHIVLRIMNYSLIGRILHGRQENIQPTMLVHTTQFNSILLRLHFNKLCSDFTLHCIRILKVENHITALVMWCRCWRWRQLLLVGCITSDLSILTKCH